MFKPRRFLQNFFRSNSKISMYSPSSSSQKPGKLKNSFSPSSQQWLRRQFADPYVRKAREADYRARSAFKLLEIQHKYGLVEPGMMVLDCGAAPGSWTQVLVEKTNSMGNIRGQAIGTVIACDLDIIAKLDGATLLSCVDLSTVSGRQTILQSLDGRKLDGILSDMAPNATGNPQLDHERLALLIRSLWDFILARELLKERGFFVCKMWDGGLAKGLVEEIGTWFRMVKKVKPKACREASFEFYIVAREFKSNNPMN